MTIKKGKFDELLAVQVAGGCSIKSAAEKTGCSLTHAYHISSEPSFKKRVAEIRSESVAAAVGGLSIAASQAVDTLIQLLDEVNEPRDRLNASKAILAALLPLSEFGELRERIDRLESSQLRIAQ